MKKFSFIALCLFVILVSGCNVLSGGREAVALCCLAWCSKLFTARRARDSCVRYR